MTFDFIKLLIHSLCTTKKKKLLELVPPAEDFKHWSFTFSWKMKKVTNLAFLDVLLVLGAF